MQVFPFSLTFVPFMPNENKKLFVRMSYQLTLGSRARKRKPIAEEIVATERSYVSNLSTFDEVFRKPLMNIPKIPKELLHTLFSNSDTILAIHIDLLKLIEDRFASGYHPHLPLGDIFLSKVTLSPYSQKDPRNENLLRVC